MKNKWIKRLIISTAVVFLLLNVLAGMHAYRFTHFNGSNKKTKAENLTFFQKATIALTGIDNPRPANTSMPARKYKVVHISSNVKLEGWYMNMVAAKGTVILFHGYTGEKSGMLDKGYAFMDMGYNVLLVDFMGAGNSEGNNITVGYKEAENVQACYDYIKEQGEDNIYLFGTSMGAVAILKAIDNAAVQPKAIIIECPYGTMMETVKARFKMVRFPTFPMAHLFVFWGGLLNGFWGFSLNPQEFAKVVKCPTLLLYGAKDDRVSIEETNTIFKNLGGPKELKIYPDAAHENYLKKYPQEWVTDVSGFLDRSGK